MPDAVLLTVNGRSVIVQEGCTVATAVALSGATTLQFGS